MSKESSRKRSASTAGMGPPDKKSAKKKKKLETKLGVTLTRLQQVLGPGTLILGWKKYDPDCFVEEMRRMGDQINALTPRLVEDYVTDGRLKDDLDALDIQEEDLKRPVDP
jgi:hypothetical protein